MGKRIYKRSLALGVAIIMLTSMSSVSYATENELVTPEEDGFIVTSGESEELAPVLETVEEKGEGEIEHEPEENIIDAEVEEVVDEMSEETEVSDELVENDDNTNGYLTKAVEEVVEDTERADKEDDSEEIESISDNTIPDNAYIIANGDVTQGIIVNEDEFRWYAFEINSKS